MSTDERPATPAEQQRELLCMICGAEHPVWFAADDLWNRTVRRPDGSDEYPFLCPTCLARLAAQRGVADMFRLEAVGKAIEQLAASAESSPAHVDAYVARMREDGFEVSRSQPSGAEAVVAEAYAVIDELAPDWSGSSIATVLRAFLAVRYGRDGPLQDQIIALADELIPLVTRDDLDGGEWEAAFLAGAAWRHHMTYPRGTAAEEAARRYPVIPSDRESGNNTEDDPYDCSRWVLSDEHPHPERFHPGSDVGPDDDRCPNCGKFHVRRAPAGDAPAEPFPDDLTAAYMQGVADERARARAAPAEAREITQGVACVNDAGEVVAITLDEWGSRQDEPAKWAARYPGTMAVRVSVRRAAAAEVRTPGGAWVMEYRRLRDEFGIATAELNGLRNGSGAGIDWHRAWDKMDAVRQQLDAHVLGAPAEPQEMPYDHDEALRVAYMAGEADAEGRLRAAPAEVRTPDSAWVEKYVRLRCAYAEAEVWLDSERTNPDAEEWANAAQRALDAHVLGAPAAQRDQSEPEAGPFFLRNEDYLGYTLKQAKLDAKQAKLDAEQSPQPSPECPVCIAIRAGNTLALCILHAEETRALMLRQQPLAQPSPQIVNAPPTEAAQTYKVPEVRSQATPLGRMPRREPSPDVPDEQQL